MRAQGKDYIEIGVVQLSAVGGPKYLARDHEMWWDKKNKKLTAFKKHTFVFLLSFTASFVIQQGVL